MTVDLTTFKRRCGSGATESDDDLTTMLLVASQLVTDYVGTNVVPQVILDEATLLVAVEKHNQDKAPNGVLNVQWDDGTGATPIKVTRDPLTPAYPILSRYVAPLGFA